VGPNDIQVFLGEIRQGTGQALLADLLLPPRAAGIYRLIQADVTYDVPGSGLKGQRAAIDVTLDFVNDATQTGQVDERIMNLIEKVVAHRLQTQALDDAAAGDASRATQRLRAAATRLLELGEVELARQADQQADLIEKGGHLDPAAAQKMRYATKRLTEIE
jgi:Ca-activated chloride channel family protein